MTTGCCAELLKTLKLSLSLGKICGVAVATIGGNTSYTTI